MSSSSFSPSELFELLARRQEGDATAHDPLRDLLCASPEARKYYLAHMQLTAHLCWTIGQVDSASTRLGTEKPDTDSARHEKRTVVLPMLASAWSQLTSPVRFLAVGIPALLFVYFASLMLSVIWDRAHRANTANEVALNKHQAIAVVTRATDAKWSEDIARQRDDSWIRRGAPLQLEAGIVELKLAHGTNLSVHGPAQWSVDGDNQVSLRQGRLIAQVPPEAVGFTIQTPTAEIVDLGTEFGVDVDATGRTDVQVLQGTVNVDYSTSDDKSKSARRSVRMTAGHAKRFSVQPEKANAVTASEIPPWIDKGTQVTKRPEEQQKLSAETKYAAAVMVDRPLGYWRFSDNDGHRATDASGHGNHGEYLGFVRHKNPGICPSTSDRSIRFLGKEYRGCVQIKDFEFPASCTVELWARSTSPAWNAYGWLLSCSMPNGVQLAPMEANRSWRVLMYNARVNISAALDIHDGPPRIDDRFHQYAFTYDAATDRGVMYCDGAVTCEAAKMYEDQPRHEAARVTLYVGRLAPGFPYETWGEGFVDELAIYGEALTPEGMKRHYEAAQTTDSQKASSQESASPLTK